MSRLVLRLLACLACCLGPAAADPLEWRSYPNGERAIQIAPSASWLLLEARRLDIPGLEATIGKLDPGAVLARVERLLPDRIAIEVLNLPGGRIAALGGALRDARLARRAWPAWQREAGVGFFDDQLAVAFRAGPDRALAAAAGVKLLGPTRLPGVWRAVAEDGDALRAAWALQAQPAVRWAEPDLIRHVAPYDTFDDPELGAQWHLAPSGTPGSIDAEGAWAITTGDRAVVMGIFDTGYDMAHADLAANVVGGFDAIGADEDPTAECGSMPDGAGVARSCPGDAPFRESHGTAVAGVVAAVGGNASGGLGVCPGCSLYLVRLIGSSGLRSLSNASTFQRAADDGVWAINNSWGPSLTRFFPLSQAEREVFDRITTEGRDGKGVVLVFAAGNDYFTPATANPFASHPGVITVSASTRIDDFACYSNYGSVIALAGPSRGCFDGETGIATADYTGDEGYGPGDFTPNFGGTSAASPVVAGVVGLILTANPELTAQQVRLVLQASAEKILADKNPWQAQFGVDLAAEFAYDARGFSPGFGYGRVNAARAVAMALNDPPAAGGPCDDRCLHCVAGRCAPPCEDDATCPGASRCLPVAEGGPTGCVIPAPQLGDIGQPCDADCETCVDTLNSEQRLDRICTAACADDSECPFGFDCRTRLAGEPAVCVPGNAECGAVWDTVRCQSDVRVIGGNVEYCSCDCLPGSLGACPEGFICSPVNCQRARGGLLCEPVAGRGNYLPMCVPDPDYRASCLTSDECPGGTWCIDRLCQVDRAAEGCDACAPCSEDADCGADSACVSLSRGRRCAPRCEGDGDACPGDSECVDLPGPAGFHCVNPDWRRKGFCPRAYRCEVDGRCFSDSDCAEGRCEDNRCPGFEPPPPADQGAPAADAGVEDASAADAAPADAGPPDAAPAEATRKRDDGGCQASPGPGGGAGLTLLALLGWRRRRRG